MLFFIIHNAVTKSTDQSPQLRWDNVKVNFFVKNGESDIVGVGS